MSGSKPRRPTRSPADEADTDLMPLFDKLFRSLGAYEDKVDDIAQKIRELLATDLSPRRPRRSRRGRPPVVEDMQRTPQGDGSLDLSLDGAPVVRLPPLLAALFEVLVDDKAGSGTVGHAPFKSGDHIVARVNDSGVLSWTFKTSSLAQALSLLRRRRSRRGRPPVVEDMQRTPQGDGSLDLSLDGAPVVRLPPLLAALFEVLVDDKAGSGTVGHAPFKSGDHIVARVNDSGVLSWTFKTSSLAQALSLLRQRLDKAMDDGGDLLEQRRGHGWRIVIRRDLAA